MKLAIAILIAAFCSIPAKAQTVYTYESSSGINGQFALFGPAIVSTMPIAVDPLAFFFIAGGTVFDQYDSTGHFEIGTDSNGAIDHWWLDVTNGTNSFFSEFYGSAFEATDAVQANGVNTSYLQGDAGKWLIAEQPPNPVIPTPEPATWLETVLGIMGLIGFAVMKRKAIR